MITNYIDKANKVSIIKMIEARNNIYHYIEPTNLIYYGWLSEKLDVGKLYIKHENHNPTGSFKIRGALNYLINHLDEAKEKGVIVTSRGNFAHAIAYSCWKLKIKDCTILIPEGIENEELLMNLTNYGAKVIIAGKSFEDACSMCRNRRIKFFAKETNSDQTIELHDKIYIEQGNEPDLINGIGTMFLEIFEDLPEVDIIIVPIGGGSTIAALLAVAQFAKPDLYVVGVEPKLHASFYECWKEKKRVPVKNPNNTNQQCSSADGLASDKIFEVPFLITNGSHLNIINIKKGVDNVFRIEEDEINTAVRWSLKYTHNAVEGAGAICLKAVEKLKDSIDITNKILLY